MELAFEPRLIRNTSCGAFLEKVRVRQTSSCLPSPVCFSSNSFQFYPCETAEKDVILILDDYRMAFPLPRNFNWMKILSTLWHYKKWWLVLQMPWLLTLTHRGLCILANVNLTRILSFHSKGYGMNLTHLRTVTYLLQKAMTNCALICKSFHPQWQNSAGYLLEKLQVGQGVLSVPCAPQNWVFDEQHLWLWYICPPGH